MKLKLSLNERRVLSILVQDGRGSNTRMAKSMGITPQAVGKIQDKLEREGIIRGYSAQVDYEKLGVDVFAVALFRFKSGSWTRLEKQDIRERVKGPHLIRMYRFSEGDITHMVVYGFRSLKELDNYFHVLQTERGHISELKKIYALSADSVMKDSPAELIQKVLDEYDVDVMGRPEPPKPMPENR
jgi:DNA-binding Lrp family transcriptional regulator